MIETILGKILLSKTLNESYDFLKSTLKKENIRIHPKLSEIEDSITQNIQSIVNWSQDISFIDLKSRKSVLNSYIPVDYYVVPRRQWLIGSESERIDINNILHQKENIILVGTPGSGKTTTMKYICQKIFHDDKFFSNSYKYPIVVRLREFNSIQSSDIDYPLITHLLSIIGISPNLSKDYSKHLKLQILAKYLEYFKILLIIDGFDELGNFDVAKSIIGELNEISLNTSLSKLIITSRTGEVPYGIQNTEIFELCGFSKEQITEFAYQWLADESIAEDFLNQISNSPYKDSLLKPITLAHLCALYERYKSIPDKPKSVYKKIINLLIEEWDEQRGIKRKSKFSSFTIDRKYDLLTYLAFNLTTKYSTTVFKIEQIKEVYYQICESFMLPESEVKEVLKELESQNGILLQSGYQSFEFVHKSFQEFLSAEYLVKLSFLPKNVELLRILPNELAIAVTLSSNPTFYFSMLIQRFMGANLSRSFISTFVSRLIAEKPDFVINPLLGVAFILLYEACLSAEEATLEQNKTLALLEHLFKLAPISKSIDLLESYYYISDFDPNSFSGNFDSSASIMQINVDRLPELSVSAFEESEYGTSNFNLDYPVEYGLVLLQKVKLIVNDLELDTPEELIVRSSYLQKWINN